MIYILLAFFVSCSFDKTQVDTILESKKLDMVINGFEGIAVFAENDSYNFHIESKVELDTFIFSTCSRELFKESAWNVKQEVRYGPFKWLRKLVDSKTEIKFDFRPNTIERDDCLLEFYGISKGAQVSSAAAVLSDRRYSVSAYIECNGDIYKTGTGVSVCQSRVGKYQSISFDVPMYPAQALCGFGSNALRKHDYLIEKGFCSVIFHDEKKTIFHKLTTYGYDAVRF